MFVTYTNQIQILQLSDLHFGEHHICNPAESASGKGIPTFAELISDDLQTDFGATVSDVTDYADHTEQPLIIAVSGDFTQRAQGHEFKEAESFLDALISKPLINRTVLKKNVYAPTIVGAPAGNETGTPASRQTVRTIRRKTPSFY
jgi:3',5'-cyclic AMP phosphodiesterase CpdA